MSRIEELIREKCPDGVEYKKLKSVCSEVIVPMRDRPKVFDGEIPWCRIEDIEGRCFNESLSGLKVSEEVIKEMNLKVFPTGTVICSCSASIGVYAINTRPLITNQTFIGLVCSEEIVNKYLLYYMETQTKTLLKLATTGTIPYISRNKFEDLEIPVPPIEVQQEMVRILDKFTELEAELQAELDARKRQYEYYRDELFVTRFFDGVEYIKLEKLCSIITKQTGFDYSETIKSALVKEASRNVYSFIQNKDFNGSRINLATDYYIPITVAERYPKITIDTPSLLVSLSGKVGNVGFYGLDVKAFIGGAVGICKLKEGIVGKYIMYYLMSAKGQKYLFKSVKAASHINLTVESIRETPIPVTSTEIQQEIVRILDAFRELEEELQAELDARKKQYEYYRDKLLTFKRKEV